VHTNTNGVFNPIVLEMLNNAVKEISKVSYVEETIIPTIKIELDENNDTLYKCSISFPYQKNL
jgi:hypothetical protein